MNLFNLPKIVGFLLMVLLPGVVNSQDFAAVDKKVNDYPKSFASPEKLASQITADFSRDDEKARAAFTWIALNVRYDLALLRSGAATGGFSFSSQEEKITKQKRFDIDMAERTLRTKKGVCHGYSLLFNRLAELSGLESVMIPGTSKSHPTHIGKTPDVADHAWNAVKIDGKWQLLDVTWGAGGIDGATQRFAFKFNPAYFFTPPALFFLNHFPDDKKWLLVDRSVQQFVNLPLYYGDYLLSPATILTPTVGIVSGSVIKFDVDNLSGTSVTYVVSSERIVKQVLPKRVNDQLSSFEVKLEPRASGYLTIYIDNKSVVTYKIKRSAS